MSNNILSKIFRGDRIIWGIFFSLCLISIIARYSTNTYINTSSYWFPITKSALFLLSGTIIILLLNNIPTKFFSVAILGLPIAWILLIIVRFLSPEIDGINRWLLIGGISFQPLELAKLCLIISVSFFLSKYKNTGKDIFYKIILCLALITCGIIYVDDFSIALLLFFVVFLLLFIGQIPIKKLLKIILFGVLAGGIFISVLFLIPKSIFPRNETWKARISMMLDNDNLQDDTYGISNDKDQSTQIKNAIMRGGFFGKQIDNSNPRDLEFFPNISFDFLFLILIEDFGLLGAMCVLLLYVILFIRAGIIVRRCENLFSKFLVIGCSLILVMQALAHMAVTVNLIPVTRQPLPLVSQNGTSMLMTCVYIGIILSASRHKNKIAIQTEEECNNIDPEVKTKMPEIRLK